MLPCRFSCSRGDEIEWRISVQNKCARNVAPSSTTWGALNSTARNAAGTQRPASRTRRRRAPRPLRKANAPAADQTPRPEPRDRGPSRETVLVAIGLGGNVDNPVAAFRHAIQVFSAHLEEMRVAPLYRSAAISPLSQADFLNTVLLGRSRRSAETLLAVGKALEHRSGRQPAPRNSPRPLDVDLLLWGDRVEEGAELTLPHPRMRQRRFVLQPLCDLSPSLVLAGSADTVQELLCALGDTQRVDQVPWPGEVQA